MTDARSQRGLRSYLNGLSAEEGVLRHYLRSGLEVVARRWRGHGGEIDLIARSGDGYVFVEVKAARDFDRAADRLSARQMRRLAATAEEFLCGVAGGLGNSMRFDVALVNGRGQIAIHENAIFDF